jgi:hypothetical protein
VTLIEKMEMELDKAIRERQDLRHNWDLLPEDDPSEETLMGDMLKNEGKVQGMLKMVGIMRSTSMKMELARARARLQYGCAE